ncbi:glutathione S-transferase family protein [Rhizobium leguminosarum]|uniref:glutathione S-transferase family protein n=1 Tax=Rhizobium leguminosarum TaxID=384 RepID=UPI003F98C17E
MILIGQYDSPFVRRVAIAMTIYGIDYDHRPWSTFGEAEAIAAYNPLRRVPTLVLDDNEVLIESSAILDYLDELVGPARALIAQDGKARRQALKVCALATGLGDKTVALIYERVLHKDSSDIWVDRCRKQVKGVLEALEGSLRSQTTAFWAGDLIGHADIAVTCALRQMREAFPDIFEPKQWPSLAKHYDRCESLEHFKRISQRFHLPA